MILTARRLGAALIAALAAAALAGALGTSRTSGAAAPTCVATVKTSSGPVCGAGRRPTPTATTM